MSVFMIATVYIISIVFFPTIPSINVTAMDTQWFIL